MTTEATVSTVSDERIAEIFGGIETMAAIAGWQAHELAVAFATCAGSLAAAAAENATQLESSVNALRVLTESQARADFLRKGQTPVWN